MPEQRRLARESVRSPTGLAVRNDRLSGRCILTDRPCYIDRNSNRCAIFSAD
jgi:hypothetical protein